MTVLQAIALSICLTWALITLSWVLQGDRNE